jgi:SAM-dependent methyltransferase
LSYERCAELSWVIDYLQPRFHERLQYLDIGTGESPLPSFLYAHANWDIACLDKCSWVRKQQRFVQLVQNRSVDRVAGRRFVVVEADLLTATLPDRSFDVVTCISVIEHFEGGLDTVAIKACARLLRPGGKLILTTLINEKRFAEFYVRRAVYGKEYCGSPVFYQRHYDLRSVTERLIKPSGLLELHRLYFGDYGFQCFEKVMQRPKPLRVFYAWNTPWLAGRYLTYRPYPVSRRNMRMNTASGLILVLAKSC